MLFHHPVACGSGAYTQGLLVGAICYDPAGFVGGMEGIAGRGRPASAAACWHKRELGRNGTVDSLLTLSYPTRKSPQPGNEVRILMIIRHAFPWSRDDSVLQ